MGNGAKGSKKKVAKKKESAPKKAGGRGGGSPIKPGAAPAKRKAGAAGVMDRIKAAAKAKKAGRK